MALPAGRFNLSWLLVNHLTFWRQFATLLRKWVMVLKKITLMHDLAEINTGTTPGYDSNFPWENTRFFSTQLEIDGENGLKPIRRKLASDRSSPSQFWKRRVFFMLLFPPFTFLFSVCILRHYRYFHSKINEDVTQNWNELKTFQFISRKYVLKKKFRRICIHSCTITNCQV